MSRYAVCDICGFKDDAEYGKGPIILDGVVLQFRHEVNPNFICELEICGQCKVRIFEAFPQLTEAFKEQRGE